MALEDRQAYDPKFRFFVHLVFVCPLRSGEDLGIETKAMSFTRKALMITQSVQRLYKIAIEEKVLVKGQKKAGLLKINNPTFL